jgi:2-polyprenyl-6-hydroxyphenyl methylase/3-demethylubiquinone-9 3-methyltransferase
VLCPKQQEFTLPLYSWYPGPLKRYCERLAVTTHPALANYAKYPAVHWFSFYELRDYLKPLGFDCLDRFDLIDPAGKGTVARTVIGALRAVPPLRFLGHVATPSTYLVALKHTAAKRAS